MPETAAALPENASTPTWRMSTPHVRKALAFIKRKGSVTAEELVAWDRDHGRRLFNWDDPDAAEEWRKQQARIFLNRFRAKFDDMRVRAFIHIHEDEAVGIERSAYFGVSAIASVPAMREQVVGDITRRMAQLASELAMWKLTPEEQAVLFKRLADVINERTKDAA